MIDASLMDDILCVLFLFVTGIGDAITGGDLYGVSFYIILQL